MTTDRNATTTNRSTEALSIESLDRVAGGLNPQPLPPRVLAFLNPQPLPPGLRIGALARF